MARGPLPNPNARRRNAPTIPGTVLPAGGRKGAAPKCPYDLGPAGKAWWKWGWSTPQATQWDTGSLYIVARRAQLEDELAALREVEDGPHILELLGTGAEEAMEALGWLVSALKSHATGSTSVMREMREIDNRLGLSPKSLADLRWTISAEVTAVESAPTAAAKKTAAKSGSRARLRAV